MRFNTIEIDDILTNYEELLKVKQFLQDFVHKVVCVDPIDRPICDEEDDEETFD